MIRLCVEVLGFFVFIILLINIGQAEEKINFNEFQKTLKLIINKGQYKSITVEKPKIVLVKIRQL